MSKKCADFTKSKKHDPWIHDENAAGRRCCQAQKRSIDWGFWIYHTSLILHERGKQHLQHMIDIISYTCPFFSIFCWSFAARTIHVWCFHGFKVAWQDLRSPQATGAMRLEVPDGGWPLGSLGMVSGDLTKV